MPIADLSSRSKIFAELRRKSPKPCTHAAEAFKMRLASTLISSTGPRNPNQGDPRADPVRRGADIFYETHGSGTLLLLMAGTACDGEFWKPYQVPDVSRDHTVITFDKRGTGKTTTRGKDYLTRRLAADEAHLVAHVGLGPAIVLGHSMG